MYTTLSYSTAGLSEPEELPLTLSTLPVELLLSIFFHLAPSSLHSLSLSSRYLRSVAQPQLFHSPLTQSLVQLDRFLEALSPSENGLKSEVRELTVVGRVFKSKGYGLRVMRILRLTERLNRLEIVGVDDLRPKHLVTCSKTLTHLSLLNSSFRPHSLVSPPNLIPFFSSLTHLTLSNLGLPPPQTHLSSILLHCLPTLQTLAISSIRDLELFEFRQVLKLLSTSSVLSTLILGFLTEEQVTSFTLPLLESTSLYPALSQLTPLKSLTFTLPHPSLNLLLSIPPTLEHLTIRPPYSRTSLSTTQNALLGNSKRALLAVLNPVPSTPNSGSSTPLPRSRTQSVPLELLEEEESILSSLSLALSSTPPKNMIIGEEREEVLIPREGGVVGIKLKRVRWECSGLRGGREKVREIWNERELNSLRGERV